MFFVHSHSARTHNKSLTRSDNAKHAKRTRKHAYNTESVGIYGTQTHTTHARIFEHVLCGCSLFSLVFAVWLIAVHLCANVKPRVIISWFMRACAVATTAREAAETCHRSGVLCFAKSRFRCHPRPESRRWRDTSSIWVRNR